MFERTFCVSSMFVVLSEAGIGRLKRTFCVLSPFFVSVQCLNLEKEEFRRLRNVVSPSLTLPNLTDPNRTEPNRT